MVLTILVRSQGSILLAACGLAAIGMRCPPLRAQSSTQQERIGSTTTTVSVRSAPLANATVLVQVPASTPLRINGCTVGWCRVTTSTELVGYVLEEYLNLTTDVKVDPGAVFIEGQVDEKPALMSQVQLDYPDLLRRAGIEGTVLVEVIIDTTGHAEPASMRIVQSSNRAFELSARDAVLKSLYRPGRVRGQAVRVLVQVPINFSIRR